MVKVEGKKVILRDWISGDIELYKHWQIGNHEWKNWDGPYYQNSENETLKQISSLAGKIAFGDFPSPRTKLVIADAKTNVLIGTVNSYWISKETNWLAAGIIIFDPIFWAKGLGKEALKLWISYLFNEHAEIVRLDLQTWSGNQRMMSLAAKLGFKLEGQFRKARIVKDEYYDSIQFGILRKEWASINP